MALTVLQILPAMEVGGVEKGTLEIANGLVQRGHRSIVVSAGGRLVQPLCDQGSEHIDWPIGKKSILTLRYVKKLRHLLLENAVDIVHVRSRLPAWIAYLAWKKMDRNARPKFITTVHGAYSVNAYSAIMTRGEKVIVTSEFIKNYVTTNYNNIDEDRLTIIHRGVASEEFPVNYKADETWQKNWEKECPLDHKFLNNKFMITLPARITRLKGAEDFIEIIHSLKMLGIPVIGIIAGKPHPRQAAFLMELKEQVRALDLSADIQFIGHRDDLKEVMATSNVVVSLSKKPEAFGRTTLESLSLGVPVVAYNHGGSAEILNALFPEGLVTPNDINAAVLKLQAFYKNKFTIKKNTYFTLQSMIDKTVDLYESMAAESCA